MTKRSFRPARTVPVSCGRYVSTQCGLQRGTSTDTVSNILPRMTFEIVPSSNRETVSFNRKGEPNPFVLTLSRQVSAIGHPIRNGDKASRGYRLSASRSLMRDSKHCYEVAIVYVSVHDSNLGGWSCSMLEEMPMLLYLLTDTRSIHPSHDKSSRCVIFA